MLIEPTMSDKLDAIGMAWGYLELVRQDWNDNLWVIRNYTDEGLPLGNGTYLTGTSAQQAVDIAYEFVSSPKEDNHD
jgi:hypothetical protein